MVRCWWWLSLLRSFSICRREVRSRFAKGSSRSNSWGCCVSARASSIFWNSPPESFPMGRCAKLSMLTWLSVSQTISQSCFLVNLSSPILPVRPVMTMSLQRKGARGSSSKFCMT